MFFPGETELSRSESDESLESGDPAVPIGTLRILRDGVDEAPAEVVPLSPCPLDHENAHGHRPRLPGMVEYGLAVGTRERLFREGIGERGRVGRHSRATPIMASRVTSSARAASSSPSDPLGRVGSTR